MSALFNLFYIYDPWLFHFIRMSFVIGGISLLVLVYQWYKNKINKIVIPLDSLFVVLALILGSALPLLINGTKELGVLMMYSKMLMLFSLGVIIYNLFYQGHDKGKMIKDLEVGISIQAIIGILALAGIPLFIQIAINTNAAHVLPRFIGSEQEYRLYNFTSSAFFQLSIFYLMLLHFLLAYGEKKDSLNPIYILLILVVGLISGRTFLVFSIFSLAIYFKWRYLPAIFVFAGLVLFLVIKIPTHPYVAHSLEPLINLLYGGSTISSSTDTLMQKHLFLPQLKQFIMGDGLYYIDGGSYYGGSDSGFIRQTLYGGLGYILLCFAFSYYFIKRIADNWFNGSWKFILSSLFLLSLLNIKADTYAYPGIMFIFLMFISLFGDKGKQFVIERK